MKGMMLAFIATALFNMYALLCKILVGTVDPLLLIVCTQVAAGALIIAIMDLAMKVGDLCRESYHSLLPLFLIGIISSALAPVLFIMGLKLTTLTNTVLISRAEGVIMSVLAVFVLKETITKHQVAGTAVMFCGIWFISAAAVLVPHEQAWSMGVGDILVFMSAVAYALSNVLYKKYLNNLRPEVIVSMRNVFGAVSLLVAVSVLSAMSGTPLELGAFLDPGIAFLLGFAIVAMIAGQLLWYGALEKTSANRVSVVILFSPVIGVAYAAAFLGEAVTAAHLAGGGLIVAGLLFMEYHSIKAVGPLKRKFRLRLRPMHSA